MCEFAAQDVRAALPHIAISVSRVEAQLAMDNDKPNYTADTLTYLKTHDLPTHELIFVISSEIVSGPDSGIQPLVSNRDHPQNSYFSCCVRARVSRLTKPILTAFRLKGGDIILLDSVKTPDISSTTLRHRLEKGESPLALAQEGFDTLSIAHYLQAHNYYQSNATSFKKAAFHHSTNE